MLEARKKDQWLRELGAIVLGFGWVLITHTKQHTIIYNSSLKDIGQHVHDFKINLLLKKGYLRYQKKNF